MYKINCSENVMYNTIRGWRDDGEKRGLCWYPNLNYRQNLIKRFLITRASACGFIICWYSLQEWISVSSAWSAPSFVIQKWKYSFIKFTQIAKVGGNDWDWSLYLRFHNFNIKKEHHKDSRVKRVVNFHA